MSAPKKPIEKKILHAGRPPPDAYRDGTKLKFHFVTKKGEAVLDDSRTWNKPDGPMEIIVGKKFKLEAWEMCLHTMGVGEVSSFVVNRQLTCNYPTVAKTLRDSFDKRGQGKKKGQGHQHMCGMMAMQMHGGLGYDDLNELMKEPSELEFIMELLSVDLPEDYEKESWQMDAKEKGDNIPQLKEEGNALYKQKKMAEAAEKYSQALGLLEQLMLREKPNDEEWLTLRESKLPLLLNFAQCKLCLEEYYPVIEHCTEVLEVDEDNVKALYRRGRAHIGAWNPEEAKEDLNRVIELDPKLETACKKELKRLEEMEREKKEEDKERLRNMF